MRLNDTAALIPQLGLEDLVQSFAPEGETVETVIVAFPEYLSNLSSILKETDKEVLKTEFLWKIVQSFYSAVEADAVTPLKQFNNELQGKVLFFLLILQLLQC